MSYNLVTTSDSLASSYYQTGQYAQALQQNYQTLKLLGHLTPEIARNSAACYSHLKEPHQAVAWYKKYLELGCSETPQDLRLWASYHAQAGLLDQAENILVNIKQDCFEKYHDLAQHLFRRCQWKQGFETLSLGKQLGANLWIGETRWRQLPRCARWQGQDLANKKICLVGECGLGDELIFARWIPHLLCVTQQVFYLTDNSLGDVFCHNWPRLRLHDHAQQYDFWLPTMDLPQALQSYHPQRPSGYIQPHEDYQAKWRQLLPAGKIFAVNWTGSRNYSENHFRDIDINAIVKYLAPHGEIINVCMETPYNPPGVIDVRPQIRHWHDTLAILSLSSQVFSSCSSVAHAAGAIGHAAAVYTRPDDYFTWNSTPSGTLCLWHPSVTVWRTKKIGHWHEIIAESFSHTKL
jgi:tetratricopeptide (TPR) repeat protein